MNKIRNLLYNKNYKIEDNQLEIDNILKVYNNFKIPIIEPILMAEKLNIYKNVWRQRKYYMLILSRYIYAYQTFNSKTYYDAFIDKYYEYSKVCNEIYIEYDDDEYGSCEVKKKIKMIGSECNKNDDCVSNVCKQKICRLNYDVDIINKLNFIN